VSIGTPTSIGTATCGVGTSDPLEIVQSGIAAGDLVVVSHACNDAGVGVDSVTVDGESFSQAVADANGRCDIWYLKAASAHTADIVVTFADVTGGNHALSVLKCATGIADSPLDKTHAGNGTGTTPSTGASGTLSQAPELVIAAIATMGPVADAAGTWNVVTGIDRVGVGSGGTAATIASGYGEVLEQAHSVTVSKSGITSRAWGACVATFKADLSVSGAIGSAGISASPRTAEATGAAAIGSAAIASAPGTLDGTAASAIGTAGIGFTANATLGTVEGFYPQGRALDPFVAMAEREVATALRSGVRSYGKPYFAMSTAGSVVAFPNSAEELVWRLTFALYGTPAPGVTQAGDPMEARHVLYSYFEEGALASDIFYLAVTPNGRLVAKTKGNAEVVSPTGVVRADGVYRTAQLSLQTKTGTRTLSLDDSVLVRVDGPVLNDSCAPNPYLGARIMLFNGRLGTTMCACGIKHASLTDGGTGSAVGGVPNIRLYPGALYFGEGYQAGVQTIQMSVYNDGVGTLTVNARSTLTELVVSPASLSIGPKENKRVTFTFFPTGLEEDRSGEVYFSSDDPIYPSITVPVSIYKRAGGPIFVPDQPALEDESVDTPGFGYLTYALDEGAGAEARATCGDADLGDAYVLRAGWYEPVLYPRVWGPADGNARSAYRWERSTPFVRKGLPTTGYTVRRSTTNYTPAGSGGTGYTPREGM
jgi:hypothetical protein